MMSEAIDETLDKDEAEEETEELTNQVAVASINSSIFLLPMQHNMCSSAVGRSPNWFNLITGA